MLFIHQDAGILLPSLCYNLCRVEMHSDEK